MKRFAVKVTCCATDENPNFAGKKVTYYYGKNNVMLGRHGSYCDLSYMPIAISKWELERKGYKRLCDAKRNWSYNNLQNDKFWQSGAEIVEFELEEA